MILGDRTPQHMETKQNKNKFSLPGAQYDYRVCVWIFLILSLSPSLVCSDFGSLAIPVGFQLYSWLQPPVSVTHTPCSSHTEQFQAQFLGCFFSSYSAW